jgi:hypothetical protein
MRIGLTSPSCIRTAVTSLEIGNCNQLAYQMWHKAHAQLLQALTIERKVVGWSAAASSQTPWSKYWWEECKLEAAPSDGSRLGPADFYACAAYQTALRVQVIKANTRNLATAG